MTEQTLMLCMELFLQPLQIFSAGNGPVQLYLDLVRLAAVTHIHNVAQTNVLVLKAQLMQGLANCYLQIAVNIPKDLPIHLIHGGHIGTKGIKLSICHQKSLRGVGSGVGRDHDHGDFHLLCHTASMGRPGAARSKQGKVAGVVASVQGCHTDSGHHLYVGKVVHAHGSLCHANPKPLTDVLVEHILRLGFVDFHLAA